MLGDALQDNLQLPANYWQFCAGRESGGENRFHHASTRFVLPWRGKGILPPTGVTEM
jgi:hypothetical protein